MVKSHQHVVLFFWVKALQILLTLPIKLAGKYVASSWVYSSIQCLVFGKGKYPGNTETRFILFNTCWSWCTMIAHITAFQYIYDNMACCSNSSRDVHMRKKISIKRYSPKFSGEITYISILVLIDQVKMGTTSPGGFHQRREPSGLSYSS